MHLLLAHLLSPQEKSIPIVISYLDSMFMPMYGDNMTVCTVKFLLKFNGTLSEETPIEITNATCMSYVPYNITIQIGFPQAIDYDLKNTLKNNSTAIIGWGGTTVLTFRDSYIETNSRLKPIADFHIIYPIYHNKIYFPVSGDYAPIIELTTQEHEQNPTIYRYDKIKVHVDQHQK